MGLLSGQMSFRAFDVDGGGADEDVDALVTQARRFAFRELAGDQDQSAGWVSSANLLDTDLDRDKLQFAQYLVLSLRVDKKAVAAHFFKARLELELEAYKKKANTTKVSVAEKKDIRETLRRKLIGEAEPRRAVFDVCWDMPAGRVYFFASSDGVHDIFTDLFKKTFAKRLNPIGLESRLRRSLGDGADRVMKSVQPARFV